ncbi:DUF3509 domain-containing protein [Pseudomonas sp. RL]|uniref:DUF3509 domain-containing protein n=1 Tax=Pseudomonas sp. RL TaxID=1452718 RepID=UPI00068DD95C|nr:DUF3509 domain-containing protein [Pseudomonas sp. RL]
MSKQESPIDYLIEVLSKDYRITRELRPDASLVLTLHRRSDDLQVLRRVVTAQEQRNPVLINDVLERVRRDLLAHQGPLQKSHIGYFHKRLQLPYF